MTTKTNRTFTQEDYDRFIRTVGALNIPDDDITEGLDFVTDYMRNNPLTDDNRSQYIVMMAVAAYHAGKNAAK
jgi:hypothetical protein